MEAIHPLSRIETLSSPGKPGERLRFVPRSFVHPFCPARRPNDFPARPSQARPGPL